MRHRKKFNHLGRKSAHRKAMLSNMAISLIEHKRIKTTLAKAKALRTFVEPIINRSKDDTTHSRRLVFKKLQNKNAVSTLFREVSQKVSGREGGYTRILKLGNRLGDNAEMCYIELVDYNEVYSTEKTGKTKRKRTRRGGSKNKTVQKNQDATEKVSELQENVKNEVAEKQIEENVENSSKETSSEKEGNEN